MLQTWKDLRLGLDFRPDDTYFQYTTVRRTQGLAIDVDDDSLSTDRMDDVDIHADEYGLWLASGAVRRVAFLPQCRNVPQICP